MKKNNRNEGGDVGKRKKGVGHRASALSGRGMAISILGKWMREGVFPSQMLSDVGNRREAAMAMEIVYGVLRNLTALDFIVGKFCRKKPQLMTKVVLYVGAWQLLFSKNIPAHAAVSETLLAAEVLKVGYPSFINAVLRNIDRSREMLFSELENAPLSVAFSHPERLIRRWLADFGEERTKAILRADSEIPGMTAVVLPFKDVEKAQKLVQKWVEAGIQATKLGEEALNQMPAVMKEVSGSALDIPHGVRVEMLPGFLEGEFMIQDRATLLSLSLLAPKRGEIILDACAAPGGKSMQIAASVSERDSESGKLAGGKVFAFDAEEGRLERLRENAERTGLRDVIEIDCMDATAENLSEILKKKMGGKTVDAILADVPCSNSGVFRRRADARWRWREDDVLRLVALQLEILVNLSKVGAGRIVYSTCSIDCEEDERVVAAFLARSEGAAYELIREEKLFPGEGYDGSYAALLVRRR